MAHPPVPARTRKQLKRPNGFGSVYKIKDKPIYVAQFYKLNPVTGEKKKTVRKFRTKKDALLFLDNLNNSALNGRPSTQVNEKSTIREFLDTHIDRYVRDKKAPETLRNYESARNRICSEVGAMNASKFLPRDVEVLIEILESKYKINTVCNAFALLSLAYNKSVKIGEMPSNPCLRVDAPKRSL